MAKNSKGDFPDNMGHPAMSKVKLEGPKKNNDYHGPDASVAKRGDGPAVPNEAWERQYDPTPYMDTRTTRGFEFNPMKSDHRMTTYIKTNKCDN